MEVILATGLLLTTPILLAALGGAIDMQAGIVNLGLDGMLLAGAFMAVFVDWKLGNVVFGCLAAAASGAILGYLFALPITRLGANQIIAGLGLGVLMPGFFGYILPTFFNEQSTLSPSNIPGLPVWHIPGLSQIPGIGPVLFSQDPITYLSWLCIPATWFLLYQMVLGLRMRAAGHNPNVAVGAGLSLERLRELATAIAGMLAGLGGAQLALVGVQVFNKDMTAGRGYIALAAFYFGRSRPVMTAFAALIFGISDSVSIRLRTTNLPDQIPEMIPYLAVIVALIVVALRQRAAERKAAAAAALIADQGTAVAR
jgi:simple sugar transport system permease protein